MIPKIIHFSWLSGDPFPESVNHYLSTWKKHLPDYQIMLWDASKMTELGDEAIFAQEAFQVKKWAFAADYIRLFAVYKYGGIWLDSDVEIFKNLDVFLTHRLFIGWESWEQENHSRLLTAHFFGAEANHPFIKECLDEYKNKHFIKTLDENLSMEDRFEVKTIPEIMADKAEKYGFDRFYKKDKTIELNEGIVVYPSYFFCRPQYHSIKKVYGIHRVAASWREGKTELGYNQTDPKKMTLKVLLSNLKNKLSNK